MQYSLKKEEFNSLVSHLLKDHDFIAPVEGNKQKSFTQSYFKKIQDPKEIYTEKKSYYPVKGFFFKNNETIFEFNGNSISNPALNLKKSIFFGLRRCDLNGIWHQDIVFLEENTDPFYKARRDSSLLIGLHCKEGDDYCFCNSVELKDFFDLMFYNKNKVYAVEVGTEKGQEFINNFSKFFKKENNIITKEDKKIKNKKSLKTIDIKDDY